MKFTWWMKSLPSVFAYICSLFNLNDIHFKYLFKQDFVGLDFVSYDMGLTLKKKKSKPYNSNNLNIKLSNCKVQNTDIIRIKGTHDDMRQFDSLLWLNLYFISGQLHHC